MQETLVVFNPNSGNVSLTLRPWILDEQVSGMAQNKARKFIRSSICSVIIKRQHSLDLCAATRMTVAEIKSNPDYLHATRTGKLHVLLDSSVVKTPSVQIPIKPIVVMPMEQLKAEEIVEKVIPEFLPTISAIPVPADSNFLASVEEREETEDAETTSNKRGRKPNKKGFFSK